MDRDGHLVHDQASPTREEVPQREGTTHNCSTHRFGFLLAAGIRFGVFQVPSNLLQVLQLLSQPLDFAVDVMARLSPGLSVVVDDRRAVYFSGI